MIAEHQRFDRKHKGWDKAGRFVKAYLYKEKNANRILRSYVIRIKDGRPDPVPIKPRFLGNPTQWGLV